MLRKDPKTPTKSPELIPSLRASLFGSFICDRQNHILVVLVFVRWVFESQGIAGFSYFQFWPGGSDIENFYLLSLVGTGVHHRHLQLDVERFLHGYFFSLTPIGTYTEIIREITSN